MMEMLVPCGICCVLPMTPYVVVMIPENVPIHLLFIVINKKWINRFTLAAHPAHPLRLSVKLELNMNRLLSVYFQVFVWLFG